MSAGGGSFIGGIFNAGSDVMAAGDKADNLRDDADVQTQNAANTRKASAYNASRQSIVAEQSFGRTAAGYGAAGVTSSSGSALDILRQSHTNAELDRMNILYGGEMQAQGMERKASGERAGADRIITNEKYQVFSDLFGGASKGIAQSENYDSSPSRGTGGYGYGSSNGAPSSWNGGAYGNYPTNEGY